MTLTLAAITLGLVVIVTYAASCWIFPFARCRLCEGRGMHQREDRKVHRLCWWCKGSGRRLRIGRRLWNHTRRLHRENAR